MKSALVNLLIVICTATDNVNQNVLLEYFMKEDFFPALISLFHEQETGEELPHKLRYQALQVISILSYYQKYEQSNHYASLIGEVDKGAVVAQVQATLERQFELLVTEQNLTQSEGVMSRLSTLVSFWTPPATEESKPLYLLAGMSSFLLCMYDWIHCNAHFRQRLCSPDQPSEGKAGEPVAVSTLLQMLLRFASNIVSEVNNLYQAVYVKICSIIMLCLTEDGDSAALLHDPQIFCPDAPGTQTKAARKDKCPVVCSILELCVLFLKTNLKRKMQFGLYMYVPPT